MRYLVAFLSTLVSFVGLGQSAHKIHFKAVLVDTHNDVLSSGMLEGIDISKRVKGGHSDLVRWKEGGVDVQFFSVWTGEKARNREGFYKDAVQEIDSLNVLVLKNPMLITLAQDYRQVKKGLRQQKLVALIGVEGGHMIEDNLGKLEQLYQLGMRYMTLTWNNSTSWASSAMDETQHADSLSQKGLTDFGKQVVKKMNELGVIVDLSHTGEQTFYDAIAATVRPVILSHSSVWNICPVFRNVKDEQIRAVAKNGGVICINFYSGFISKEYDQRSAYLNGFGRKRIADSIIQAHMEKTVYYDSVALKVIEDKYISEELQKVRPTLGQLVDHIDYIVKLVGDDYVGIGSDYDGVGSLPVGLEDVTTYPKITEELIRRGYSKKSVNKILGGNILRVMKANFK
jgi:membrane dipeptidase